MTINNCQKCIELLNKLDDDFDLFSNDYFESINNKMHTHEYIEDKCINYKEIILFFSARLMDRFINTYNNIFSSKDITNFIEKPSFIIMIGAMEAFIEENKKDIFNLEENDL
jgi:hypothetical protein